VSGTYDLLSTERDTIQTSERKPVSRGHSLAVECRAGDWSGRGKKARKQRELTFCRTQSDGLVRTVKESQPMRGTHSLSSIERGTSQDSKESQQVRGTHKLSSTERGSGQDSNRKLVSEGTHVLSSAGRGTGQDSKRKAS
jgi:hypothetical protein